MAKLTFSPGDLFVSPNGKNSWSGTLPKPNAEGTDGPFATIEGARDEIRRRKSFVFSKQAAKYSGAFEGPVTVWVRGGTYRVTEPISFDYRDSAPVTYRAYPGETPIVDGSTEITGWKKGTYRGRECWAADVPDVREKGWSFRELFVNGERRMRPRYPKKGLFSMESVPGLPEKGNWQTGRNYTRFVARPGDLRNFDHIEDIEVVYLHFWIEERTGVASYDETTRTVVMTRPSAAPLYAAHGESLADYYLDNVAEELSEPGEWYLDRAEAKVYYLPLPGEKLGKVEICAPRTLQLLTIQGDPDAGRFVEFLRFDGIVFQHTDWRHPDISDGASFARPSGDPTAYESRRNRRENRAACNQAAADVPGVIFLEAARYCRFTDCTVQNVGWYGFEIADASRGNAVTHCTIRQTGAGGIRMNGASAHDPVHRRTGDNALTDNEISAGGRIFHSAVGILSMHAFNNEISHNHIWDYYYTGISVGWVWGYMESVSRDNRIEYNHIHQIGQGLLSDMGGIYTLGVQPGTTIRGNHIHDITKAHYGGWCIYPDEGSSHMLIEANICYDTNDTIFNQHYGRENMVRNNLFAFGEDAVLSHSKAEYEHCSLRFERNILIADGEGIFRIGYFGDLEKPNHTSDLNLMWDIGKKPLRFIKRNSTEFIPLEKWQEVGHDRHSVFANPKCADIAKRDFTLAPDSPATKIGFVPVDPKKAGPRKHT
jgi:hypothetical protein